MNPVDHGIDDADPLAQEFTSVEALHREASTVRAGFIKSYQALPAEAAQMLRFLGLHPGPAFGVQAAAALDEVDVATAQRLLEDIVAAHLIQQVEPDRYRFAEPLRICASGIARSEVPVEQQNEALKRVLAWYLHAAHAAGIAIQTPVRLLPPTALPTVAVPLAFAEYVDAVGWYEKEWANLRFAIMVADHSGLDQITWQLSLLLRPYFPHSGSNADKQWIIETALNAARRDGDLLAEAEALSSMGGVYAAQHRLSDAVQTQQDALALFSQLDDHDGKIATINKLGVMYELQRQFADASEHYERARALGQTRGDKGRETTALFNLASAYHGLGRYVDAIDAARQSLTMSRELGDRRREMVALVNLARSQADVGAVPEALAAIEAGLDIARARGDRRNEGWALLDYGRIQQLADQHADALVSYERAAALHIALEDREREAVSLNGTGKAYQRLGRIGDAIEAHRQATLIARELNDPWLLASSLDDLGAVLAAAGNSTEAQMHWQEALLLLQSYTDPEALSRRNNIAQRFG